MAYTAWSVVFGEQPSAAKWNILGSNDASFNDGTGLGDNTITLEKINASVAFRATSTQTIGTGIVDVTTYSEVTDAGADFNPATGLFTVPYNGVYQLNGNFQFADQTGRLYLDIIASTTGTLTNNMGYNNLANGEITACASISTYLVAGETVKCQLNNQTASAALINSSFSGFLVGRT